MSLLKRKKISKSEIILKLSDTNTRNDAIEWMKNTKKIPIPRSLVSDCEISLKRKKYTDIPKLDSEDAMKKAMEYPKHIIEKSIRESDDLSRQLTFKSPIESIFYKSILLRQKYDANIEYDLLIDIQKQYNNKQYNVLKYCHTKFTKRTLADFMKSNICDFKQISNFLVFLAPKLSGNILEIWFENDFEVIDGLFSRLGRISLRKDLVFDKRMFSHMLQFKPFKKAVFNGNMSRQFIVEMRDFANRADYEYFYNLKNIKRIIDPMVALPPRDFYEFEFFNTFEQNSLIHSNMIKIRSYQSRIGHNFILNRFIRCNLQKILRSLKDEDVVKDIFRDTIIYNNEITRDSEEYSESIGLNDDIFEGIKNNEDAFRPLASFFRYPKDKILQNLIMNVFDFTVEEASNYINVGYNKELIEYFKTKSVCEFKHLINEWNDMFFLKLFSSYNITDTSNQKSIENAVTILEIIQRHSFKDVCIPYVAKIYDQLMNIPDARIFKSIPESLKIVFVLRNRQFAGEFISMLNRTDCTPIEASWLYEIKPKECVIPVNNLYLSMVFSDHIICNESVVETLFLNSLILKEDSFGLFVANFDDFISQSLQQLSKEEAMSLRFDNMKYTLSKTSGIDRITANLEPDVVFNLPMKIAFVMSYNLSNKFVCFILFDKIVDILNNGSSVQKIFILNFINPKLLVKEHILRFIDSIIPLLNSSSSVVCTLSKARFNQIEVENQEIQTILPEIIRAFLNKEYFNDFLHSFKSIQFNNYLCFNSLNLLIQILLKYIYEYTNDCLEILKRIVNITKDKDIKHVSGLIFSNISRFVVSSNFYTTEALDVASQFCVNASFADFEIILKNLQHLRISNYLVGILKIKGDSELNDQIIRYVLETRKSRDSDIPDVEPAFIASACELDEFSKYLDMFIPLIKDMFKREKMESRQIASKAFKSILDRPSLEEYFKDINDFIVESCITSDHFVRLQSLDITRYLPIIFVLKYDQHSLVKKKALEVWKSLVPNTNKELKTIYGDILDFVKYSENKVFSHALSGMIAEMAQKYTVYLEMYIQDESKSTSNKEFILVEACKNNRLQESAVKFCKSNYSPDLFKLLYKNASLRNELIEETDDAILLDLCAEDSDLAFYLLNRYNDPIYIDFLSTAHKIEAIKQHNQAQKSVSSNDEVIIFILQSIESCSEIENLLVRIHPSFSYYYISVQRVDYGGLTRIFERVFDVCYNLDELVCERNIKYIKSCCFDRVDNKDFLLKLLIELPDKHSFDRIVELINTSGTIDDLEQNVLFEILGYLFRNMLTPLRKHQSAECILVLYKVYSDRMGYFKIITEDCIFKE